MFELEISRDFSAAHQLRGYNGDCSNLHGHNYKVLAVLRAKELDAIGIAVDFKRLKATLDKIIGEFDHTNLSDNPRFQTVNPTSEIIAREIYQLLSTAMNDKNVKVYKVSICESESSKATYFED